jgi:adenylate kinase
MPKELLQFIFINGKGGSGKDTQAELFLKEHREKGDRISTGDIYRGAKGNTGEFCKYHERIAPYIAKVDAGGFIPDNVIVGIVKEEILARVKKGKEIFIFTGFPRTEPQLTMVDKMLAELNEKFDIRSHHIYYSLSDETCRERARYRCISARRRGEPTRVDDEPIVVERRLEVFRDLTEPMIKRLSQEDRLIRIDAEASIAGIEAETSARLSKERS